MADQDTVIPHGVGPYARWSGGEWTWRVTAEVEQVGRREVEGLAAVHMQVEAGRRLTARRATSSSCSSRYASSARVAKSASLVAGGTRAPAAPASAAISEERTCGVRCRSVLSNISRHLPWRVGRREHGWANGPSDSCTDERGGSTLLVLQCGVPQLRVKVPVAEFDRLGRGDLFDPLERLGAQAIGE